MGALVAELGKLIDVTFQTDAAYRRVESSIPGEPIAVIGVPGLAATNSHLAFVRAAVLENAPRDSVVELYRPRTIVNLALMRPLLPLPFFIDVRTAEVRALADKINEVSEEQQRPVTLFAHSLGGVVALEAWNTLREPERVIRLVTAGSPHRYPFIGVSERPDNGQLHTIGSWSDRVVPRPFATHNGQDTTEVVSSTHLGLIVDRRGITAIANAVANVAA